MEGPGAVDCVIGQITAGFEALAGLDLTGLTDVEVLELVVATQRVRSMADAACVGATRTAVQVRDRGCAHPSCDVALDRCQVDHVEPYDAGGETTQANGQCLCKFHNLRKGNRPPPPAA